MLSLSPLSPTRSHPQHKPLKVLSLFFRPHTHERLSIFHPLDNMLKAFHSTVNEMIELRM